jgi:hypothetical protein
MVNNASKRICATSCTIGCAVNSQPLCDLDQPEPCLRHAARTPRESPPGPAHSVRHTHVPVGNRSPRARAALTLSLPRGLHALPDRHAGLACALAGRLRGRPEEHQHSSDSLWHPLHDAQLLAIPRRGIIYPAAKDAPARRRSPVPDRPLRRPPRHHRESPRSGK